MRPVKDHLWNAAIAEPDVQVYTQVESSILNLVSAEVWWPISVGERNLAEAIRATLGIPIR